MTPAELRADLREKRRAYEASVLVWLNSLPWDGDPERAMLDARREYHRAIGQVVEKARAILRGRSGDFEYVVECELADALHAEHNTETPDAK